MVSSKEQLIIQQLGNEVANLKIEVAAFRAEIIIMNAAAEAAAIEEPSEDEEE